MQPKVHNFEIVIHTYSPGQLSPDIKHHAHTQVVPSATTHRPCYFSKHLSHPLSCLWSGVSTESITGPLVKDKVKSSITVGHLQEVHLLKHQLRTLRLVALQHLPDHHIYSQCVVCVCVKCM